MSFQAKTARKFFKLKYINWDSKTEPLDFHIRTLILKCQIRSVASWQIRHIPHGPCQILGFQHPCPLDPLGHLARNAHCATWTIFSYVSVGYFSFVEIMEFTSMGRGEKQQRGNKFHEFQVYFEQSIIKVGSKENNRRNRSNTQIHRCQR